MSRVGAAQTEPVLVEMMSRHLRGGNAPIDAQADGKFVKRDVNVYDTPRGTKMR